MSDHKYTRRGQRIETAAKNDKTGLPLWHEDHDSLNQAKRKSREIQMAEDGALGRGCVRVN